MNKKTQVVGTICEEAVIFPRRTSDTHLPPPSTDRYLMRELERTAVIGAGRLGNALSRALDLPHPLRRGERPDGADVVILCVPDAEIGPAAAAIAPGPLVG